MVDSKTCPALMVCVSVDDKNFRKSLSYFRLKRHQYEAKTAVVNTNNADAVTAALTDASLVVQHKTGVAIISNDAAISSAAATAAAEETLVSGSGFTTVAALETAYNTAIAATTAITTSNDMISGTTNNETITATNPTLQTGEVIIGFGGTDTVTITSPVAAVSAAATIVELETKGSVPVAYY